MGNRKWGDLGGSKDGTESDGHEKASMVRACEKTTWNRKHRPTDLQIVYIECQNRGELSIKTVKLSNSRHNCRIWVDMTILVNSFRQPALSLDMCYLLGLISPESSGWHWIACVVAPRVLATRWNSGGRKSRPCVPANTPHSQCNMWSLTAWCTRLLMALLVFAAQMQQLGIGWKT